MARLSTASPIMVAAIAAILTLLFFLSVCATTAEARVAVASGRRMATTTTTTTAGRLRKNLRSTVRQVDACSGNPCQNGGKCLPAAGDPGFSCVCLAGFTGDTCDSDSNKLDDDAANPFVRNGDGALQPDAGFHNHAALESRLSKIETELAVRRAYDTVSGLVGASMSRHASASSAGDDTDDDDNDGGAQPKVDSTTDDGSSLPEAVAALATESTTTIVGPPSNSAPTPKPFLVGIGRHPPDLAYPLKMTGGDDTDEEPEAPIAPEPDEVPSPATDADREQPAAGEALPGQPDSSGEPGSDSNMSPENVNVGLMRVPAKETRAVIIPGETHEDIYNAVDVPPKTVTDPRVLDDVNEKAQSAHDDLTAIHNEVTAIRNYVPHHYHVNGPFVN